MAAVSPSWGMTFFDSKDKVLFCRYKFQHMAASSESRHFCQRQGTIPPRNKETAALMFLPLPGLFVSL